MTPLASRARITRSSMAIFPGMKLRLEGHDPLHLQGGTSSLWIAPPSVSVEVDPEDGLQVHPPLEGALLDDLRDLTPDC
jgi:hypothetical protein